MANPPRDLSESVQDYLKTIYDLTQSGGPATTNQIAERMSLSPASVTVMVQRMAQLDPPLVVYQKHRGVQLTDVGRHEALRVIRRHRLIESFLLEKLGFPWEEVHAEADRLEHAASDEFVERLSSLLEHPDFDPHGDPIPDRDLNLPPSRTMPLSEVATGKVATVRRVHTSDSELLQYLGGLGVHPGATVRVLDRVPFDDTTTLRVEETHRESVLGAKITSLIQVELAESNAG